MSRMPNRPDTGGPDAAGRGRIVAHRGASRVAPENTLAAFRLAAAQGARWIEFDLSLLGDGTPVLHHDETVDRCTDRTGALNAMGAGDLAGIDSGSWFGPQFAGEPLATLAAALDLIGAMGLYANLEMKTHGGPPEPIAGKVAAALGERPWTARRVLVSSFRLGALAELRMLMPGQPIAVLYNDPPADWPDALAALGACSLHIRHNFLSKEILSEARALGFHVRVFTTNEPGRMAPFREDGLTGVFTNHPPLFLDDPDWAAWAEAR